MMKLRNTIKGQEGRIQEMAQVFALASAIANLVKIPEIPHFSQHSLLINSGTPKTPAGDGDDQAAKQKP